MIQSLSNVTKWRQLMGIAAKLSVGALRICLVSRPHSIIIKMLFFANSVPTLPEQFPPPVLQLVYQKKNLLMLFKELYSSPLCYQYSTKPLRNQFLTNLFVQLISHQYLPGWSGEEVPEMGNEKKKCGHGSAVFFFFFG